MYVFVSNKQNDGKSKFCYVFLIDSNPCSQNKSKVCWSPTNYILKMLNLENLAMNSKVCFQLGPNPDPYVALFTML